MILFLSILFVIVLLLYVRERRKRERAMADFHYINLRLHEIVNKEESSYILVPSHQSVVKETAANINNLLEKFYMQQIDYHRSQKTILQLFTNISHDLRTPITVLKGYIEMLYLQSKKEQLSPSMESLIEKMQSNSKELVHSVNNLFNMAKIQSGDLILQIEKTNLTRLCHEVILEFYDLLEKEHFVVEMNIDENPVYAKADAEAVKRILKNLIHNAIHHGGSGKFLGISLYEKEGHAYLNVEDHGRGISTKEKELIFTRAYTGDRHKGNGLGLAISQGLAQSMEGFISVKSIPDSKTVFTVQLKS